MWTFSLALTTRLLVILSVVFWGCGGRHYPGDAPTTWARSVAEDPFKEWELDLGRAVEFDPFPLDSAWVVPLTDKRLTCISVGGSVRWSSRLKQAPSCNPVAAAGLVMAASGPPKEQLYAFDAANGEQRWRVRRECRQLCAVGQSVIAVDRRGRLTAHNLEDGSERWAHTLPGAGVSAPVYATDRGVLFLPVMREAKGGLVAFDIVEKKVEWDVDLSGVPMVTLVGQEVIALTETGDLVVIDRVTGSTLRRAQTGLLPAGGAAVDSGLIVVTASSGVVAAFDLLSLDPRWRVVLQGPLVNQSVAWNGRFLQTAPRGSIVVLDKQGEIAARAGHPERLYARPSAVGNVVLVGGSGGTVVGFSRGGRE